MNYSFLANTVVNLSTMCLLKAGVEPSTFRNDIHDEIPPAPGVDEHRPNAVPFY